MSKLLEAINKARREGQDLGLVEPSAPVDPDPRPAVPGVSRENSTGGTLRDKFPDKAGSSSRPEISPETVRVKPTERVVAGDRHRPPEEHMVSLVDRSSFAAERFRTLRHLIEQKKQERGLRVVAVASAASGEGRSLIAANLAGALAQNEDARVLLVDADLRKPTLQSYLGLQGQRRGLVDAVLDPTVAIEDVIVLRDPFNLSILPAGSKHGSPYEVLSSERFTSLLASVSAYYDYVVIDTPALSACPDARLLQNLVDGYLIVAAADKTPRKQLDEALAELAPEKVLGIVFNGQREVGGHHQANGQTAKGARWWKTWRR